MHFVPCIKCRHSTIIFDIDPNTRMCNVCTNKAADIPSQIWSVDEVTPIPEPLPKPKRKPAGYIMGHPYYDGDDPYDELVPVAGIPVETPPETFGFDRPEDGSEERFANRRADFKVPWLAHTGWWLVHNVIAHPLIGFFPVRMMFRLHDYTSRRLHGIAR